ncbi:MAG: hypothetical protein DRH56_10130, partial [Deltaproteobacteria bacterium]
MFRKMTVGKQIGLGFGLILILLGVITAISYEGISGSVRDALSMTTGEKIKVAMAEREIEHLKWLARLSAFLTNPDIRELDIQTDPGKCALGRWLHGTGRKEAVSAVPDLAPLFIAMEEPHRRLHESAVAISRKMNNLDTEKTVTLFYEMEQAERRWNEKLQEDILSRRAEVSVQTDPKQCMLGKWLYGGKAAALSKAFPAFADVVEKMKEPYGIAHETALEVNEKLSSADFDGAMDIVAEKAEPGLAALTRVFKEARDLVWKFKKEQDEAAALFKNTLQDMKKIEDIMGQVRKTVDLRMITESDLLSGVSRLKGTITVAGLLTVLLGISIAFFITRRLVRSLSVVTDTLNEGAEQVAAAAEQVSSASQSLAEGASEQASSLEETSSSLEELAAMTRQNADNSAEANRIMQEDAVANLKVINDRMEQMKSAIAATVTSSEETGRIIKTIDEIAFQTNLLALNAAVEAARAGEAGAGFAVVADEVRNLAMRAADAAKNTSELIEEAQTRIGEASDLNGQVVDVLDRNNKIAAKVAKLIDEIAAASNEQSRGIEQINSAVSEMEGVTQRTAANAEESAAAAEELNAQAEQMKTHIQDLTALIGRRRGGPAESGLPKREPGPPADTSLKACPPEPEEASGEASPDEIIPFH